MKQARERQAKIARVRHDRRPPKIGKQPRRDKQTPDADRQQRQNAHQHRTLPLGARQRVERTKRDDQDDAGLPDEQRRTEGDPPPAPAVAPPSRAHPATMPAAASASGKCRHQRRHEGRDGESTTAPPRETCRGERPARRAPPPARECAATISHTMRGRKPFGPPRRDDARQQAEPDPSVAIRRVVDEGAIRPPGDRRTAAGTDRTPSGT